MSWETLMEVFAWLEQTALSLWVRESVWGFPLTLIAHSLAMGFLVGANIVIALPFLGATPPFPPGLLRGFYPLIAVSFVFSLLSGLLLLLAYPAKGLTNPVFYLKFLFITLAFLVLRHLDRHYLRPGDIQDARRTRFPFALACASLLLWAGAITAGRFLAYTYSVLTVS